MQPAQLQDNRSLGFALVSATLMIAHQVAGKATRDALFLSYFDVTQLPKVVIASAVLSMVGVLAMSWLLPRHGPRALVPAAFAFSAILFLAEWFVFAVDPRLTAVILYLHMAVFGATLVSGFWSLVNERFDPHSAKRTFARIAAAATLGGVLGGLIAERVSALMNVGTMLPVLAILHLLCAAGVAGVGTSTVLPLAPSRTSLAPGLRALGTNRYLQRMGLLMVLVAAAAALVDYAFKAEAAATLESGEALVAFFATFYAAVGLLSFGLQTALGPQMLHRFGIASTLGLLPAALLVTGLLGTLVTRLWTVLLMRASHGVLVHSFFRSAFELLYTPLAPHTRRAAKPIVDVAADRIGDIAGAGLILLLLALVPHVPPGVVAGLAVLVALFALGVVERLHRGYVEALAFSLRAGAVSLRDEEVTDATTQTILAETSVGSEREQLMARIKAQRRSRQGEEEPTHGVATVASGQPQLDSPNAGDAAPAQAASHSQRLAEAVADLSSGDIGRIRKALFGDFMDLRLVPHLLPLLGQPQFAEDVRMELRWIVPRIIGQLGDALLDPEVAVLVRQRIPGVLEVSHNPRVVEVLLHGLRQEEFGVRYSCARALARMRARNSHLRIPAEAVFAAVEEELNVDRVGWESKRLDLDHGEPAQRGSLNPDGPRVERGLDHVFTMLSLVFDHDALQIAQRALEGTDLRLRGTALEYLENILPENIRQRLWPHLGIEVGARSSQRSLVELVSELRRYTAVQER